MSTQQEKLDAVKHLIPENCTDIEEIAQAVHVPPTFFTNDEHDVSEVLFLVRGPEAPNESGLTPDEEKMLKLYRSLSRRSKLMAIATMQAFAAVNTGEYGE